MPETLRPNFTLRTLPEIKRGLPRSFWLRYSKPVPVAILRSLHPGSQVKVLAQSVGHQKNPCETLWIRIKAVVSRGSKFIGEVNTIPDRTLHHGLEFGMQISFEAKHIIDVLMKAA